jgi:Uma2 family endonuclease
MTQPKPRIKFTVDDYMTTPDDKRYQLLDGELISAPSPIPKHQTIAFNIAMVLHQFITARELGQVWVAPLDVVMSPTDVAQPDILFVSNARSHIVTEANIQGAPDLVVEILSPGTASYDRGYKRTLYSRHGVLEYWLVDPEAETVEVLTPNEAGLTMAATLRRSDTLTSPLLAGLAIDLEQVFR